MSCNGDCCERFSLSYSKEMFNRLAQEGIRLNGSAKETQIVADMVITLPIPTYHSVDKDGKSIRRFHFTCRHFDTITRKCMIYDKRPSVCRTYPNANKCADGCLFNFPGEQRGCQLQGGTPHDLAVAEFKEIRGLSGNNSSLGK